MPFHAISVGFNGRTCTSSPTMLDANDSVDPAEVDIAGLSEWLRETYYDEDKSPFFSETELEGIGNVLLRLLRFRPSERPSADQILSDPLFAEPFSWERSHSRPVNDQKGPI